MPTTMYKTYILFDIHLTEVGVVMAVRVVVVGARELCRVRVLSLHDPTSQASEDAVVVIAVVVNA